MWGSFGIQLVFQGPFIYLINYLATQFVQLNLYLEPQNQFEPKI